MANGLTKIRPILSFYDPFYFFYILADQTRIRKDTDRLVLFAKVSPRLCAEARDECQCYQDGTHEVSPNSWTPNLSIALFRP